MTKTFFILCICGIIWSGCSALESALGLNTLKYQMPVPPEVDVKGAQLFAVDRFDGLAAQDFKEEMTQALLTHGYHVSNQEHLRTLLEQVELASSDGILDGSTAPAIGRAKAYGVIIKARVSRHEYSERVETKEWKDKEAVQHQTNTRYGTGIVEANLEITDLETATLIASKKITREAVFKSKPAVDSQPDEIDEKIVLSEARQRLIQSFISSIRPGIAEVELSLLDNKDYPQLREGIKYARSKNYAAAIQVFDNIARENPQCDEAFYNNGLVHILTMQYAKAIELFQKANQISPQQVYSNRIMLVDTIQRNESQIEELGY